MNEKKKRDPEGTSKSSSPVARSARPSSAFNIASSAFVYDHRIFVRFRNYYALAFKLNRRNDINDKLRTPSRSVVQ
jgi:hypothetical protein